jgi:hypothetical protein
MESLTCPIFGSGEASGDFFRRLRRKRLLPRKMVAEISCHWPGKD